ncbi:MAG: 2-amino-4-hydroxy-6-hydroxymethyldihydropteridine diphosphokinase [Chromatiales bacterium]|nr:2-amino-4-hydroxy-6-hydroxymethyldihydropteridine diphosphokinase [Chromatiales bacterium]
MPEVFVGVGSNVDPEMNFVRAIREMDARFGSVRRSRVLRTEAVGFDGDDFLNMVVSWRTDMALDDVMAALGEIEVLCGRSRNDTRFGPRTMDLDLLLYGDEIHDTPPLPRPEIVEYGFVLGPLAELSPMRKHPIVGKTFQELWLEKRDDMPAMETVSMPW